MKKLITVIYLAMALKVHAQVPNSGFAADFEVTAYQPWLSNQGLNNNATYSLYEYLDLGYTVYLDFSATWCGPCWGVHVSGTLDELYEEHGPSGFPGVNNTTTNDLMVFWMEGDPATASSELEGSPNWIEPTPGHQIQFPMFNPNSILTQEIIDDFNIIGFPWTVIVRPDRSVVIDESAGWGADSSYILNVQPMASSSKTLQSEQIVNLYPNPSSKIFTLESNDIANKQVYIVDLLGRNKKTTFSIISKNKIEINTEDLPEGIYFLNIDKQSLNFKIHVKF